MLFDGALTTALLAVRAEIKRRKAREHARCYDCDANFLLHYEGDTHCACGESWPCPVQATNTDEEDAC
jgi:hypothetical protein